MLSTGVAHTFERLPSSSRMRVAAASVSSIADRFGSLDAASAESEARTIHCARPFSAGWVRLPVHERCAGVYRISRDEYSISMAQHAMFINLDRERSRLGLVAGKRGERLSTCSSPHAVRLYASLLALFGATERHRDTSPATVHYSKLIEMPAIVMPAIDRADGTTGHIQLGKNSAEASDERAMAWQRTEGLPSALAKLGTTERFCCLAPRCVVLRAQQRAYCSGTHAQSCASILCSATMLYGKQRSRHEGRQLAL